MSEFGSTVPQESHLHADRTASWQACCCISHQQVLLVLEQMVVGVRIAVGSMFISSLTEHEVGWAEWTIAKRAGSSLAKTVAE